MVLAVKEIPTTPIIPPETLGKIVEIVTQEGKVWFEVDFGDKSPLGVMVNSDEIQAAD